MYKLILTSLASVFALGLMAQNVGIGVAIPKAQLHIVDTSYLEPALNVEATGSVLMQMNSITGGSQQINFLDKGKLLASVGRSGSHLNIRNSYAPGANTAIKISTANTVGINYSSTASPSQILDVNGKLRVGDDSRIPGGGTIRYNSATTKLQFYNGSSWIDAGSRWSIDGSTIHYTDGKVLIGRTTTIGAEHFGVRANATGTQYGGMYMETNGSPTTRPFYGYAIDGGIKAYHYYDGADNAWKLYNSGYRLTIKNTGETGIGAISPAARLDVLGGTWDVATSEGDFRVGNTLYRLALGVGTNSGHEGLARIYAKGGQAKLILGSDDTDVLTIDSDNDVGIGTLTPLSDLHIYKPSGIVDLRLETDSGNPILRMDAGSGTTSYSQLRFTENGALSGAMWYNYSNNALEFYESGTAMTVQNARVGIGTLPNVNYRLSVNGKVICEELKVQLYGNWPDYVFADDYPLMDVADLKTYISDNGHLPGVPSAAEVNEQQGIEVGEMNRILLEKVEELTLLLIRQQDEIDQLKAQINN